MNRHRFRLAPTIGFIAGFTSLWLPSSPGLFAAEDPVIILQALPEETPEPHPEARQQAPSVPAPAQLQQQAPVPTSVATAPAIASLQPRTIRPANLDAQPKAALPPLPAIRPMLAPQAVAQVPAPQTLAPQMAQAETAAPTPTPSPAPSPPPAGGVEAAIYELLQPGSSPKLANIPVDRSQISPFYINRNYTAAWVDESGQKTPAAEAGLAAIRAVGDDGLDPELYGLSALATFSGQHGPADSALFDVLLTHGLHDLFRDLRTGHTRPGSFQRDETFIDEAFDADLALASATRLSGGDFVTFVDGLSPPAPGYREARKALADLKAIKAAGGWPTLPDGPSIKPGMSDRRIPGLRVRLGVAPVTGAAAGKYDDAIAGAVRAFQQTHAIKDDGAIGRDTLAALNMPVSGRIAEVAAAMERRRWLPHDLGPRYILVNVGGFWLRYADGGAPLMQLPIIVGREERETPLLASIVEDVVVNPTWTVPPTIIRKDILPKLRADPGYLAKRHINLYRRTSSGLEPVSGVSYDGGSDYVLRQPPGEENPLGRFKLQFKNRYSIYLHDTDEKKKFDAALRNFSSGCVRVENVRALAESLLAGQRDHDQIDTYLQDTKTRTIALDNPLPIYIDYFSMWVDAGGHVIFGPDLYGKDAELAATLMP